MMFHINDHPSPFQSMLRFRASLLGKIDVMVRLEEHRIRHNLQRWNPEKQLHKDLYLIIASSELE